MSREPSWQAIAGQLAERLYHRANCADHSESRADPDNCPFCADRAAYQAWERKSGRTHRETYDGPVLDVFADYHAHRARQGDLS